MSQQIRSRDDYRENLAAQVLAEYNFGDGVIVDHADKFNSDDPDDMVAVLYVRYADDAPDADTHKFSFHVRFNADGRLADVYALECDYGQEVGHAGPAAMHLIREAHPEEAQEDAPAP